MVEGINFIFEQLMTPQLGDTAYGDGQRLSLIHILWQVPFVLRPFFVKTFFLHQISPGCSLRQAR